MDTSNFDKYMIKKVIKEFQFNNDYDRILKNKAKYRKNVRFLSVYGNNTSKKNPPIDVLSQCKRCEKSLNIIFWFFV